MRSMEATDLNHFGRRGKCGFLRLSEGDVIKSLPSVSRAFDGQHAARPLDSDVGPVCDWPKRPVKDRSYSFYSYSEAQI